jgi:hypothetical protein
MANLDNVLQQLRAEHKQAQLQVEKLTEAISVIEGLVTASDISANGTARRTISAATRRRMVQAQRNRRANAGKGPSTSNGKGAAPKRRLSTAARRKIAAAQRARWAKIRAQKKTA